MHIFKLKLIEIAVLFFRNLKNFRKPVSEVQFIIDPDGVRTHKARILKRRKYIARVRQYSLRT